MVTALPKILMSGRCAFCRHRKKFDLQASTFNAGMFVVNLTKWRSQLFQIDKELHFWMSQVRKLNTVLKIRTIFTDQSVSFVKKNMIYSCAKQCPPGKHTEVSCLYL